MFGAMCVSCLTLIAPYRGHAHASQPNARDDKSRLGVKKYVASPDAAASVDYVKLPPRRDGSMVVTRVQVKNTSSSPIDRLTIEERWYDGHRTLIAAGTGIVNGSLQPGEVRTVQVRTPVNPNMATSTLQFGHSGSGAVKSHAVKSIGQPATDAGSGADPPNRGP